jgi:hypothetical protein
VRIVCDAYGMALVYSGFKFYSKFVIKYCFLHMKGRHRQIFTSNISIEMFFNFDGKFC